MSSIFLSSSDSFRLEMKLKKIQIKTQSISSYIYNKKITYFYQTITILNN